MPITTSSILSEFSFDFSNTDLITIEPSSVAGILDKVPWNAPIAVLEYEHINEAINLANDTKYGLGCSIWSKDTNKAQNIAKYIYSGSVFINEMTKSDPRLPFGGINKSGYGIELSKYGIREFVNIKTVVVN